MSATLARYAGVRALVLGGSGFIGRWVARALAEAGTDLVVAARDPDGARALLHSLGVDAPVVPGALRSAADVRALLDRTAPQIVFDLAGYGIDRSERDERELTLVNRDLVRWVGEALADRPSHGWPGLRLVHAGSALEYGAIGGELEEDRPGRPTEPYGRSKLAGTIALRELAARTGLRAATARLFTVYGPGEHAGRLLPSLIRAADTGERVALTDGSQRRDFTYVGDVVEGMLRLGLADLEPGAIVNVATGTISTVRRFVEIAAEVLAIDASRLDFGALPTRPEEMRHDRVGTERMRRVTGWVPATSIRTGVEHVRALGFGGLSRCAAGA